MRLAVKETETENLFETLANKSPVGLYIVQDGKFCYTNPTFQSNTGYSEDELLGRNALELAVPEDRKLVRENAVKMLKGELTSPYQFRVTHKNGSIQWVMESVSSVQYRGRRATLGNFVDITAHKRAEEALQAEKNKLQSLIDAIEDHITIRDRDYNLIYMAEHVKKLWGDRTGEKCYRVFEGQDKVCDGCPAEKAFSDGKSHISERKTVTPSGEVLIWDTRANPIRDAEGRIVSCLEIARNITERKQMVEALQAEKNKLQSLIDAMEDTLTIQDMEYNIIYQNEQSRIASGGDHLGEKCYRAYEGREKICEGCPVEKAFKDSKSHTSERRTITPSGEVAFWENTANPIRDAKGRIVSCLELSRNITERKQAEEALQAERNKLQSVIDAMDTTLTIHDTEYNIIYQNEQSRIASGGAHLGEKCYRAYHSKEKLCDGCPVEKAFKDGKPHTAENKTVKPSGEVVFWEITANPIRDAGGKIVSCLELARDITERKKQEQALADEAAQRRILVEQSRDGIVVLDENGKVYEANQRFAEMLGYTPEEAAQLHIWDWDTQWTREQLLEMVRSVDETGAHFETYHRRKDGTVYDVEISTNGTVYAGQKLVFCVCRDITERKQAKETLQAEKNKLQSLIDAMEDGLIIQDRDYNIIYQNEPLKEIYGDHLGEKCYRAYAHKDKVCNDCPVALAFRDGKSHSVEKKVTLPSGKVAFWEPTANPIRDAKGKIVSCFEIIRDITERKKQEQALADELTRRRLLVDQSLDGIVVIDVDDKVYEANQRFADMLGYTLEEVRELHTWDWEKNYSREQIHEQGRKADEKGFLLETKHTRKDGSVIDVDISINAAMCSGQKLIFCVCRDVTEHRKQEQALADELTRRRLLVDKSLDGIVVLDVDAKVVEANQRFAEMLGYTLKEVRELHTWDWEKNYPHEQILEMGRNVDEKGLHLETKHTRKDGSVIDVDISISGIMYGGQKLIFCIERDITERKRAEEAINLQRAYFQQLFDTSPDAILMMDTNDRAIQANRGFEVLFGYSNEEVKGRSLIELIVPEVDVQEASDSLQRILGGEVVRKESVRRRKDGSLVDVSILAYPIRSNDKLIGTYGVYSDITERKRAEEAIKQAAEEWRNTFDSISDAISIHDRDYKILRANKGFADIFHKKPSQIIGRHCYELHKGEKPISGCPHKQTLATKKPAVAEFYESNLGKYLHEATSPIFDEKGEVVGTVHFTRDITEQKQQNERLMMADRLASIGELAAGTAHELNNPLTSVIGFSQLLMEKDIPDDIREDLTFIYNEAQRAANVTKSLLTFGRKHAPVKQLNQINNIIEDVLKLRAYEQNVNSIEVKRQLAPDLPEIEVDYFQMQQVFLNIIINAEYFMTEAHKRGSLTITTKKQNSIVRISIADDGPGISREDLSRIFNPFFTTKEAGKGTGLGLSICHGIVSEHGGQIYAKSQPGKGATIVVELPVNSH
jgi:PAS domain S-box-containing protein